MKKITLLLLVVCLLGTTPTYGKSEPKNWAYDALQTVSLHTLVPISKRKNITVAVIDSGINSSHPQLRGNLVKGINLIDPKKPPEDDYGHGIQMAGIIGGSKHAATRTEGIANGVRIMPVKVLDHRGNGTPENLAKGIRWAVDHGADVINLSLGRPQWKHGNDGKKISTYHAEEAKAITYALQKKVPVIAATGDESNHWLAGEVFDYPRLIPFSDKRSEALVCYPAALPGVIGVGAIAWLPNKGYFLADLSNTGKDVDFVAPGMKIVSTHLMQEMREGSGTSQATAYVSGMVALLLAKKPSLSPQEVEKSLVKGSLDLGALGKDVKFGYGLPRANLILK